MLLVVVSTVLALSGTAGAKPSAANQAECRQVQRAFQEFARRDTPAAITDLVEVGARSRRLAQAIGHYLQPRPYTDDVERAPVTIIFLCAEQGIGFGPLGKPFPPSEIIKDFRRVITPPSS
jgi:hypothetical protein